MASTSVFLLTGEVVTANAKAVTQMTRQVQRDVPEGLLSSAGEACRL